MMTRPLLPSNGIFVPTRLVYDQALPPALLQTWIQLRRLAWGTAVTPDMKLTEIAAILKKPPSTLYRHMSSLRNLDVFSWHTTTTGSLIVSFDEQDAILPGDEKNYSHAQFSELGNEFHWHAMHFFSASKSLSGFYAY